MFFGRNYEPGFLFSKKLTAVFQANKLPSTLKHTVFFYSTILQVKTVDGDFIPATPITGTVLVNIGDLMQRWTADVLVATVGV